MDPNEALKKLREILYADDEAVEDLSDDDVMTLMAEVSTLFRGLDEWLIGGGFMPSDWDPDPMPGGPRR